MTFAYTIAELFSRTNLDHEIRQLRTALQRCNHFSPPYSFTSLARREAGVSTQMTGANFERSFLLRPRSITDCCCCCCTREPPPPAAAKTHGGSKWRERALLDCLHVVSRPPLKACAVGRSAGVSGRYVATHCVASSEVVGQEKDV